jgi:hypothetical protein
MRPILAAAAAALTVGVIASTAAYAQATNSPSAAKASLNENYNKCVSLARSRGFTDSDLDGNRSSARNFVIRCMQGKQR